MPADGARRTADFDYDLPPELIAQHPPRERGHSRLLVVARGDEGERGTGNRELDAGAAAGPAPRSPLPAPRFRDLQFADLPALLSPGDLLVLNTTRVRHARLLGTRPSGAPAEVLLIHPETDGTWVAIGKPGSALRPGKRIALGDGIQVETIALLEEGERRVRFVGGNAEDAMRVAGQLPLPPYIDRAPTHEDEERYQTVFAEREGSVAAPTAGLHFTPALLAAIRTRGVEVGTLDLEVGPGTFKPIAEADWARHPMHPERYEIPSGLVAQVASARAQGGAVWAVGTTVVRALESAAAADGTLRAGPGETRLMIAPGYRFRVVDRLVTNFHLPRSSLLLLVAAFLGTERTMAAYAHAVRQRYRFYSYGDAMAVL
ncbi:MAG TPA: tRNA preQ1(34) S-adenosylmethionine ribosyltransferase-isomerase QueA [Gemmatimonadales bacterium]|nr:tRNA preQ1(34) S-adenosylmethionine ribosyltransferase-isomerase QueA [Gemmatimonadales bacterium]